MNRLTDIVGAIIVAVVVLILGASWAFAGMRCGPHELIIMELQTKHKEVLHGEGLSGGKVLQIWASPETGTWTILSRENEFISCVPAAGNHYHRYDPLPEVKGPDL